MESAELTRRDPPGYGDCISTDETGGFDEAVYQYVAVGETGALSAAATVVIGVPSVAVWLLNNGDSAVCLVQASPPEADFYEAFQADSELLPGEALAIRVAAVETTGARCSDVPPDDVDTQLRVRARGRRVR